MSHGRETGRVAKYFSLGFWVAVALCALVLWVRA